MRLSRHPFSGSVALSLVAAVLVAGCGGGGGGSNSGPAIPRTPAPNEAPTAAMTATPVSGGAPLLVTFNASDSTDSDGQVVIFRWQFGDQSQTAVGAVVSHSYEDPGSYTVELTIVDDDGATDTRTAVIEVTVGAGDLTLSGQVRILASSAVDGDVNDTNTPLIANDDFSAAQDLPNPVTAGGYVNRPGTGSVGQLEVTGDPGDFYRISLAGGEVLLLTLGDPANGDLAMHLWRESPLQLEDSVLVTGNSGVLSAPGPGEFFIEIEPIDGFSTYVLNVGQDASGTALSASAAADTRTGSANRTSDDFVPGELVILRDESDESNEPDVQVPGYRLHRRAGRTALMRRQSGPSPARRMRGARLGGSVTDVQIDKWDTLLGVRDAGAQAGVTASEPNYIRRPHLTPDDPFYSYQWHFEDIGLPLAWDLPQGTAPVIVAVIDTGVLLAHPDLANGFGQPNKLVPGYDLISDPARANDGDGPDPDPDDPGDFAFGGSSSFHGTHVAGTVAARSDNGTGVAGIAWDAQIMPLRALGINGGTTFDVSQAVLFAAGLANASGQLPNQRADIINMSLGSRFSSAAEQQAIDDARAEGVIVIASAGNDASTIPNYPAAYDGVVAVSATTLSRALAPYSNRGSWVDVAAPGGNNATDLNGDGIGDGVVSALGDDSGPGPVRFGYAALNGTSMAAPHIAGVAALMKAAHPGLTPAEFDTALAQAVLTDDLGAPGRDDSYGYGLINAQKALITAFDLANNSGNPVPAVLTGSPSSVNFGSFDTEIVVTIGNAGEGTVAVDDVVSSDPWLTAVPDAVDANGLGTYLLRVDRSLVADGTYSGAVTFSAPGSTFTVTAVMQRTSLDLTADAGLHYIVLVDAVTDRTVRTFVATADNGEYAFTFDNVTAGSYQIFAGTDLDNDNFLCDGGEACGSFRTLDSPDVILINSDRDDLDFVSGYRVNLFSNLDATSASPATGPAARELFSRPRSDAP